MTETALEIRRWAGKLVLFLTLCWLIVLIAGVAGGMRGASAPALNFVIMLIPGCAFVPGALLAIQLHRTSDPHRVDQLWRRSAILGVAGLVLLIGAGYALYEMGQS